MSGDRGIHRMSAFFKNCDRRGDSIRIRGSHYCTVRPAALSSAVVFVDGCCRFSRRRTSAKQQARKQHLKSNHGLSLGDTRVQVNILQMSTRTMPVIDTNMTTKL